VDYSARTIPIEQHLVSLKRSRPAIFAVAVSHCWSESEKTNSQRQSPVAHGVKCHMSLTWQVMELQWLSAFSTRRRHFVPIASRSLRFALV